MIVVSDAMLTRVTLPFLLTLAAACSDTGTREQLTVVVEADRTRALADQARLAEMQRALADAKQELVDTRKDLTELREKLMQTGALTAEEMRRLEAREASLRARESAAPAETAPAPVIAPAPTPTSVAPAATPDARAAVVTQLAAISQLRASRGLREDDIEGGPALQKRIDDALKAKRNDDALAALSELRAKTEATAINGALIKRKYARASARLDALQGDAKAQAKKLLGDANTKNAKGDAPGANAALNAVLDLAP